MFSLDQSTKNVMNSVSSPVIVMDQQGRILFSNQACTSVTGFTDEDMIGQFVWSFLYRPAEEEAKKKAFDDVVAKETDARDLSLWRNKQGQPIAVIWSNCVVKNIDNENLFVIGTCLGREWGFNQETTGHPGWEAKFDAILNLTRDGVIVTDRRGTVERVNFVAANMFGYHREELIGKNVNILMLDQGRGQQSCFMKIYEKTKQKIRDGGECEVVGQRKDKSVLPLYLMVAKTSSEDHCAFVIVVQDISARNEILADMYNTRNRDALKHVTDGMIHEFNNLLTVILGNLEMLQDHITGQEGRELLGDAIVSADLSARLIDGFLGATPLKTRQVEAK